MSRKAEWVGDKLGALYAGDGRFHFPLVPHGFILLESGISLEGESRLSEGLTQSLPPCSVGRHLRSIPPSDFLH